MGMNPSTIVGILEHAREYNPDIGEYEEDMPPISHPDKLTMFVVKLSNGVLNIPLKAIQLYEKRSSVPSEYYNEQMSKYIEQIVKSFKPSQH